MAGTGTPTDTEEFIRLYAKRRSDRVRGIMGREVERLSKNISILDVRCGIGNTLFALDANGFRKIAGLDAERQLIEYARDSVPTAHVVVASGEGIPFRNAAFDCVICYDLLEHVMKPERVVENISKVLKHNGILYMSFANGYSMNDVLFRLGGRIIRGRSSHVQRFRRNDIETMLMKAGLEIETILETKGCILESVGPAMYIIEGLPFSQALRRMVSKAGRHMSVGWELKAVRR